MKTRHWLIVSLTIALTACSTLPHFQSIAEPQKVGPRVSDIVNEIQCEILATMKASETAAEDSPLAGLKSGQYVANINLTLDVTDNQGFDPQLSYIDPLHVPETNFTFGVNGHLSGQQHRNINVTFTLLFDHNTPDSTDGCPRATSGLKGDLGIREIMMTGLPYSTGLPYQRDGKGAPQYPYRIPAINVTTYMASDPLTGSPALAPNFGSTVDFTLIYGGGAGPNWTVTHWVGPSPPSGGLFNVLRTNKDTLVLSFALVTPTPPKSTSDSAAVQRQKDEQKQAAIATAGKLAQDNVTRMILQRLLPP